MYFGGQRPGLADVIEKIGFGWAQVVQVLVTGVWALDGAVIILLSCISPSLDEAFYCGPFWRALVFVFTLLGVVMGDLSAGPIAELGGRKKPIIIAFVGMIVFLLLASVVHRYGLLLILLFFVGLFLGLGQPSLNSLLTEITPKDRRLFVITFSRLIWVAGCSYACLLVFRDNPDMINLNWRWLLVAMAIPTAIFLILAVFVLYESPFWLALHGHHAGAIQILTKMRDMNGRGESVSVEFEPPRPLTVGPAITMVDAIRAIFDEKLKYTTTAIGLISFLTDYVTYGMRYTGPHVWPYLGSNFSPAMMMLMSGTYECPGFILGVVIGSFVSRRNSLLISLGGMTISAVALTYGLSQLFRHPHSVHAGMPFQGWIFQAGFFGVQMFNAMAQQVIYVYVCEIFPTTARTMGSGVVFGLGRFGAILAPLTFEFVYIFTSHKDLWFWSIAILSGMCLWLGVLLPIETYGEPLKDHMDELIPSIQQFIPRRREPSIGQQASLLSSYTEPSP
jgi:MFS family permease